MIDVIGISFNIHGKIYYFNPCNFNLNIGMNVIVLTERGLQFGYVVENIKKISQSKCKGELKPVLRIATDEDIQKNNKNNKDATNALKKCKELVIKEKLNMQIIDSSYTFDRTQLMFRFLSDNRVDFRNLAKDLANIYRTRIELRQVGARDKAREISGYGLCGRKLCCSQFLNDLDSVSINMAKNQNISLNPSKINGLCGRLLCCLKYEDKTYCECKKLLPRIGSKVKIDEGEGKVVSINILKGIYRVNIPNVGIVEVSLNEKN